MLTSSFRDQPPLSATSFAFCSRTPALPEASRGRGALAEDVAGLIAHIELSRRHLQLRLDDHHPCRDRSRGRDVGATAHRSSKCLHVGKRAFVFHATSLLRLLGDCGSASRSGLCRVDRGLSAVLFSMNSVFRQHSFQHYEMCVGEFLNWLDGQGKTLGKVTLEDISGYFHALAQQVEADQLALHVAKLRNFFRYAESKGWCRQVSRHSMRLAFTGWRVFREARMERCATAACACAGNTPSEIRDHAMLLIIAVYGVRSGEVRHLRLEDIDWEREIIRIRRPKQRKSQHYPLVREVGAAILRYLREVRPKCKLREIFLTWSNRIEPSLLRDSARWYATACIGSDLCCHAMARTLSGTLARRICWPKAFRSRRSQIISAMSR